MTYWLRDLNIHRQAEWDQGKEFTLLYYSNAMAGEVQYYGANATAALT